MGVKIVDVTERVFGGKHQVFAPLDEERVDFHLVTVFGGDKFERGTKVKRFVQAAIDNYGTDGLRVFSGPDVVKSIKSIGEGTRVAVVTTDDTDSLSAVTAVKGRESQDLFFLIRNVVTAQSKRDCKKVIVIASGGSPKSFHKWVREMASVVCYCNYIDDIEMQTLPIAHQNYLRTISDAVGVYGDRNALGSMVVLMRWASEHIDEGTLNDPERTPLGYAVVPPAMTICTECGDVRHRDLLKISKGEYECPACSSHGVEDALKVGDKFVPASTIVEIIE